MLRTSPTTSPATAEAIANSWIDRRRMPALADCTHLCLSLPGMDLPFLDALVTAVHAEVTSPQQRRSLHNDGQLAPSEDKQCNYLARQFLVGRPEGKPPRHDRSVGKRKSDEAHGRPRQLAS